MKIIFKGRNINRHYYDLDEIEQEVQRPVVQSLFKFLKFRNISPAFDGEFSVKMLDETSMEIFWNNQDAGVSARLIANLKEKSFEIVEIEEDKITTIEL